MIRVFALQPFDKAHRQAGSQIWIFSVGFLSSAPAGIAEQIHVRCPERQSFVNIVVARFLLRVKFCPRLGCDHIADLL